MFSIYDHSNQLKHDIQPLSMFVILGKNPLISCTFVNNTIVMFGEGKVPVSQKWKEVLVQHHAAC
jgi:hypothetical protein